MLIAIYESLAGLSIIVPICLILLGAFSLAIWLLFFSQSPKKLISVLAKYEIEPFIQDIGGVSVNKSDRSLLVTVGLIVGILAGIVGIIVGVIQIGVFFGYWPEKLA